VSRDALFWKPFKNITSASRAIKAISTFWKIKKVRNTAKHTDFSERAKTLKQLNKKSYGKR
jgi:wobble nucleotide-excising tRNase